MQIDTAGTYTLKYTAEDECGNVTEVTREVEAVQISYRTVLYTDGTLIINEKSTDIDANVAEHGVATNVYAPFDPNASSAQGRYDFRGISPYWHSERDSVLAIEIGSEISPMYLNAWFGDCLWCQRIDVAKLDTSLVTMMAQTFQGLSRLTEIVGLINWDTHAVTTMESMFANCVALTNIDLSGFDTSAVTNMRAMFNDCENVITIDVSSFDTSAVTDMTQMFSYCNVLQTIYASDAFVTSQATVSTHMFIGLSTALKGGAGTMWTRNRPQDKTYARIDNPPDAPGYFTLKSA